MPTESAERSTTDRIEKQFTVDAPRTRVWRAISDAAEFGRWFGMAFDRDFAPGETIIGRITVKGYEHVSAEMVVAAMEPERYFAYRWHPYAIDPAVDYSQEPMTLVEFTLEEAANGTAVTIAESGFDGLPASRRAEAFRMNDGGWTGQSKNLAAHVSRS